ncbi:peptidyl-prolyl cis-trans isomerase D [Rhizomicrobium palustre]|uniref:Parvulin-like PPIase n=1 Tax=Rhizomicrobium palustre TaxID=189966 RepID=A0A846N266_9PROT|nr:peptidyl-prolyl cis-trans isomerase [Rhizomicrobium palustre]NIK89703.1 peptidyl-prolyl cis-trans isomerase D [Rhizomicrobium palustre]
MLQEMRKYSKSKLANVLLGILALSFVSWGAGSWMYGNTDTSVAKVGGVAIDQQDFRRDYANMVRNEANRRGEATLSPEEAKQLKIADAVLDQKVNSLAIDNVVHKLGLTASDAQVVAMIHRIPAFSGLTGQFDRATFQKTIERIGYTEQGFIELMRADTARIQLIQAIEGGFRVPGGYAKLLYTYLAEARAADYIVVDAKSLGTIPTPSDAVLQAFVQAHANAFSTPEYRDVTYAYLTPEDVAPTVKVTDEQIKQAYDEAKDTYNVPEKRDVQQLNFTSEAAAKAAAEKAKTGFDQLTNEKGEKPVTQSAMSPVDLDPAISKVVFALPKDGISQPLKTPAGAYAIFKVTAITPGISKSLDSVKDEIRTKLAQELAVAKLTDVSNAYTDASSGGMSMADAAKKVGMKSGRVNAMDANGFAPDGQKAAAPDDQEFRNIAFHAEAGEEGDPQQTSKGAIYVALVNSVTAPKVKPLDQVRDKALAAWTEVERARLLKKKAQDLAAEANREKSLDNAAKSIGASVQKSPRLTRQTNDDTFSDALVASLFAAKPGETVQGPKGKSGDYIVARVTGIAHPQVPDKGPGLLALVQGLSGQVGSTVTESYVAEQKAVQKVTYNRKNLDSAAGGGAEAQ